MGMGGEQWSRFGMAWKLLGELFWALGPHIRADVRGASRSRGLAAAVMKNRSLRNRVGRG